MSFDRVANQVNKAYADLAFNQSASVSMCAQVEAKRIPAVLQDLDARLDGLYNELAALVQRLFPVLAPSGPTTEGCANEKVPIQRCDLEIRLRGAEQRVTDMTNLVMDVTKRLEL